MDLPEVPGRESVVVTRMQRRYRRVDMDNEVRGMGSRDWRHVEHFFPQLGKNSFCVARNVLRNDVERQFGIGQQVLSGCFVHAVSR